MAYAPHCNNDYANGTNVPLILGTFDGVEYDNYFEYAERPGSPEQWDFVPEFPHVIYVGGNGEYRYGKVLKTVAYVAVDEVEYNVAVVEKWQIKKQRAYPTEWACNERAKWIK